MAGHILMFDSGIGGISVYREIKHKLPDLNIDYIFDNAYYPYGELSELQIINRLELLIGEIVEKDKPLLIVIACNSASTAALPALRKMMNIPIVGVVPAIKPAARITTSNSIGLLATEGTVNRDYITTLINEHASDCHVIKVGSNELVSMAEMAYRGNAINADSLRKICAPFNNTVDTVVLGCTHFPLLSEQIKKATNNDIALIDSGSAIADRVAKLIDREKTKMPYRKNDRAFYTKPIVDDALFSALTKEGFLTISLVN